MTAQLLDGLARWLDAEGHGAYRLGTVYGDTDVGIALHEAPPRPDRVIVLRPYAAGPEPSSRLPFDEPYLQVRVRGTASSASSAAMADELYDALHGLGPVELPGGALLLSCIAIQQPAPIGRDEAGRSEHVFNVRCEWHHPTAHRPAL